MGTRKPSYENTDHDELSGWDPRKDDFLDPKNSSIYSSNFTRSNNLARSKDTEQETHGLYVRNVPPTMNEESLTKMFSEHGRVLNAFIGKPRSEFTKINFHWAIVKVESMKDALAMISGINMKAPLMLKVSLALSEEERAKRKQEKEMEQNNQKELEDLVSNHMSPFDVKQMKESLKPQEECSSGVGRGKLFAKFSQESEAQSVGTKQQVPFGAKAERSEEPMSLDKGEDASDRIQGPSSRSSVPSEMKHVEEIVVETSIGIVSVGYRKPRPCVAPGCGNMGKLRCSICKAFYCSQECQVDDWFYHSQNCRKPPPLERMELKSKLPVKTEEAVCLSPVYELKSAEHVVIEESLKTSSQHIDKSSVAEHPLDIEIGGLNERRMGNENFTDRTQDINGKEKCFKEDKEELVDLKSSDNGRSPIKNDSSEMKVSLRRPRPNGVTSENLRRPFQTDESSPKTRQAQEASLSNISAAKTADSSKQVERSDGGLCSSEKLGIGRSKSFKDIPEKSSSSPPTYLNADCGALRSETVGAQSKESLQPKHMSTVSSHALPVNSLKAIPETDDIALAMKALPNLVDDLEVNSELLGLVTVKKSAGLFTMLLMVDAAEFLVGDASLQTCPMDPSHCPVIGSFVAAKSVADSSWYRAFIYGKEAEYFSVIFIDFGNKEKVTEIKPLPVGKFRTLPGIAMIAKVHGDMNNDIERRLDNAVVTDGQVTLKVIAKKANSVKVSVLDDDDHSAIANFILKPWYTDVPQITVPSTSSNQGNVENEKVGVDKKHENSLLSNVEKSVSPSKFIKISSQCVNESNVEAQSKEMPKHPQKESGVCKFWSQDLAQCSLNPNEDYYVMPIWVGDENILFVHVINDGNQKRNQELLGTITHHCEKAEIPSSLEIGELVCGYLASDEAWYRSEVKEIRETGITAHFVDFGNSDNLTKNNLRVFSNELKNFPIAAVQVKLARVSASDLEAKNHLSTLTTSGEIYRLHSALGEPSMFEIFDKDNNLLNDLMSCHLEVKKLEGVNQEIKAQPSLEEEIPTTPLQQAESGFLKKYIMYEECKMSPIKEGKAVDIGIVHSNGPHEIFILAKDALALYSELEELNPVIEKYCQSLAGTSYEPRQGEMCLAKFSEDGMWYRSACVRPGLESSLLIFVDYGNMEEVKLLDIRKITEEFLEIPCIARHAVLKGISQDGVEKSTLESLRELLPQNKFIKADVECQDDLVFVIDIPFVKTALVSKGLVKAA